jgi:hypothetical protein
VDAWRLSKEGETVKFKTVLAIDQTREIATEIEKSLPDDDRVIALDRVLVQVDKSQIIPKNVEGLKSDPPTLFLSKTRSILLSFDGDPIWSPIKDNELKFAVNTNWDVFQHQPTGLYYLRNDTSWLRATDLKGPWSYAAKLPDSFNKLPDDDNWKDVKANLPGKPVNHAPTVYFSTTPAELILLDGEPKYVPVPGTSLLWMSNTESDLFRMGKEGPIYYLVAGRWFRAPNLNGNWTFATPTLPEDFKRISLEHPRSRVLASVPGTQQAAEAVLLAQVPQIARVNKKETKAPDVVYQGEPESRVTRGDQGGMISRRGESGSGFVGSRGDNVYAGRDGNVYRRDQNGNWSKWDNGSWNSARDGMLNESGKLKDRQSRDFANQRNAATGERAGASASTRQLDTSTFRSLERDRAARAEGAQRTRDRGSYSRTGGSAGSYRGGGFSGGGGGFRGGGRRR